MSQPFIFTLKGLKKIVPSNREILKGLWLSFLPGAKIGVIGLNGAGKSSLLRIMAGEDDEFLGEAFPAEGITVGFLPQEPHLDLTKDVRGNIEEAVADIKNISSVKYGGAITAGLFLKHFVGDTAWAHLDIAGPAWAEKDTVPHQPRGATGFGVRTVLRFVQSL